MKLISAGRLAALALFVAVTVALVIYLMHRTRRADAPQGTSLQGRIVAVFHNTRYAHEVDGRVRFVMTAGIDKTYENGAHELEQVKLDSFGKDGTRHDIVTADKAKISDPSNLVKLEAEFIDNVIVQTSDGLTVKTAYLHYDNGKNTVDTDKPVAFEGQNYTGTCTGALIEATEERVHLLKDVDVTIKAGNEPKNKNAPTVDPAALNQPRDEKAEAEKAGAEKAARKAARKARKRARKLERRRAREAVAQTGGESGKDKTAAPSRAAKPGPSPGMPQFESKKPTHITSATALLEKKEHRVTCEQNVVVTQGADEMRADKMVAYTDATNHIERVEARGNSHLKQTDKAEIQSPDMDFFFGASHQLERALAVGGASMRSLDGAAPREARATTIEAFFTPGEHGSLVNSVHAEGDTVVQVHAPRPANERDNPTERQLTANAVTLQFYPDGKNISAADASQNAVLTVTPIRAVKGADKKTLRAPQMNGVFYETDNRLKTFTATGGVKVEIEALIADAHPLRTTTSRQLVADFLPDTQDIDRVTQEGDFKYNEGDRNGVAERATYDGQKEILNLRGKRPQVWDAKGRTQADEIDYDRQNDESHARGDVRTTYYSRESTNNSTPFSNTKSPVFITAERADARNGDGVAVYTVNARGWQDDNFVKADRIELYQDDKRMVAIGHVESALYQVKKNAAAPDGQSPSADAAATAPDGQAPATTATAKPDAADGQSQPPGDKDKKSGRRKSARSQENAPGFATADRMHYSDKDRLIHYEGNVKARQGDDHIEAAKVDVYLQQETNEVDHLNAETNVILTQPGRRGTGDHLAYTSSDGRAVLTGKSARVEDVEKGSTMGTQLTFYSRDDKITVANQQGAGRVRSTHRLTKSKAN